jgi:hypothetical protein
MKYLISACLLIFLYSCTEEKCAPPFYDVTNVASDTTLLINPIIDNNPLIDSNLINGINPINDNSEIIRIPFREEMGVKYVKVSVNGFGFEMIFDTGCSGTLISLAEANYLFQKGYLKEEDYIGKSQSQIADGSIVENMEFNLKEIIIDGKIIFTDVNATVSTNTRAPLLLGNEILNRVTSYTIDNDNKTINFKLK